MYPIHFDCSDVPSTVSKAFATTIFKSIVLRKRKKDSSYAVWAHVSNMLPSKFRSFRFFGRFAVTTPELFAPPCPIKHIISTAVNKRNDEQHSKTYHQWVHWQKQNRPSETLPTCAGGAKITVQVGQRKRGTPTGANRILVQLGQRMRMGACADEGGVGRGGACRAGCCICLNRSCQFGSPNRLVNLLKDTTVKRFYLDMLTDLCTDLQWANSEIGHKGIWICCYDMSSRKDVCDVGWCGWSIMCGYQVRQVSHESPAIGNIPWRVWWRDEFPRTRWASDVEIILLVQFIE